MWFLKTKKLLNVALIFENFFQKYFVLYVHMQQNGVQQKGSANIWAKTVFVVLH